MPPEFLDRVRGRFVRRAQARADAARCECVWRVCPSVLSTVALKTCCTRCGVYGGVDDPTEAERARACGSLTDPYPRTGGRRVVAGTARL